MSSFTTTSSDILKYSRQATASPTLQLFTMTCKINSLVTGPVNEGVRTERIILHVAERLPWICGREKTFMRVAFSDETGTVPGVVYNRENDRLFALKATVMVTDFVFRDGRLLVLNDSSVYR